MLSGGSCPARPCSEPFFVTVQTSLTPKTKGITTRTLLFAATRPAALPCCHTPLCVSGAVCAWGCVSTCCVHGVLALTP